MSSRVERVRDEIIGEFQTITTANGFRTSPVIVAAIRPLDKIRTFPEVGIEMGESRIEMVTDSWDVFNELADVHVIGAVEAATSTDSDLSELVDAAEALRHDIKRKVAEIMKKYVVRTNTYWNVTPKQQVAFMPPMMLGEKRNKALVGCSFTVRIRHQDVTFEDPSATQIGYLTAEQGGQLLNESGYNIDTEQAI